MKKNTTDIISALLILLFIYAALSKLFNYKLFVAQLGASPLIHMKAALVAWLIPAAELVVVLLLTVRNMRFLGLLASLFLLIVFTSYIGSMLLSTKNLPCSCGGVIGSLSWKEHLVFNSFFMAINMVALALEMKERWGTTNSIYSK